MTSGFVLEPGEGSAYGAGSFVFVPRDRPQGFTVSGAEAVPDRPGNHRPVHGNLRPVQLAGRGRAAGMTCRGH